MSDERQRDIDRDTPRTGDSRSGDAPDETPDFEGHRDIGRDIDRDTDRAGDGTDISRDVSGRNIDL
jgi:hypothetical protein